MLTGGQGAAVESDPLVQAVEPVAGARVRLPARRRPGVAHVDGGPAPGQHDRDPGASGPRVSGGVGQRLADDGADGHLDAGGHLAELVHARLDLDPGALRSLDDLRQVGQRVRRAHRGLGIGVAQHRQHLPQLGRRPPAESLDVGQRHEPLVLVGELRRGRAHGHGAQTVGGEVVELAGDAQPLVGGGLGARPLLEAGLVLAALEPGAQHGPADDADDEEREAGQRPDRGDAADRQRREHREQDGKQAERDWPRP